MKTNGPVWKALSGIMALGLAFSPLGRPGQQFEAASALGLTSDCTTQVVRITLASEQISFCSPTSLPFTTFEDNLTVPEVGYAGLDQVDGYGVVDIRSTAPGNHPGPHMPVYNAGKLDEYLQAIRDLKSLQPDHRLSNAPAASLWGQKTVGLQADYQLSTSQGNLSLRTLEWNVEHNGRLWTFIITWDIHLKNASDWEEALKNFAIQNTSGAKLPDLAFDLGKAFKASQSQSGEIEAAGGPSTQSLPSWWNGTICDDYHFFPATGHHPLPLASWLGISGCSNNGGADLGVYFPGGGWGVFEFECVELVMRFLKLQWNIQPFQGNGNTIKDHIPSSIVFYPNDGTHPFVPGDIITEDRSDFNSAGHTMVISGVNVNASGNGTITILEQNTSSSGARSLPVTNWIVGNLDAGSTIGKDYWCLHQVIQGWLHVVANQVSGDVDSTFTLPSDLNGPVTALGLQTPNNKILAGGDFTAYGAESRNHIVQVYSDGSLDTAFEPVDGISGTGTPQVFALSVQNDHKILLGGFFNTYDFIARTNLARLNSDGTLETAFNNGVTGATFADHRPASVNALAIQASDDRILVGGNFDTYNGATHNFIVRVGGTNGADDTTNFANPGGIVYAIAVQSDGKILIGGDFTHGILRLNSSGSLDSLFNPSPATGANGAVRSITLQEDKIYIAGNFSTYNGVSRNGIAHLNSDGSLDTTFNPGTGIGGTSPYLTTVAPQPDGRILIGGSFSTFNGSGILNLARLNYDGSLDPTFLSRKSNDGMVNAILLQPDGKILIGGAFTGYIARLLNEIMPCYTLTVSINPSVPIPGGTVSATPPPNCPGGKYISGTSVQLTAARNVANDYWFTHWSGEASTSANPVSVIMDDDKTVTANFMASPGNFHKSSPANGSSNLPADVSLSWTTSSGASSYEYCLYITNSGDCNPNSAWISTGGNTSVSLTNLFPPPRIIGRCGPATRWIPPMRERIGGHSYATESHPCR